MAFLAIYREHEPERLFQLGDGASIGRSEDNDITLDDARVSRHHARVTRRGDSFFLEDLASSNGTFVKDEQRRPHQPTELVDGDEIRIGATRLVYRLYRFVSASGETPRPSTAWSPNPVR
jgi:pSer/pThr/pTyr-binding forkhead associated (FHA) protein